MSSSSRHSHHHKRGHGLRAPKLTSAQVKAAQSIFDDADADGSGGLDLDELQSFCSESGEDPRMASIILAAFDEDHDGIISFNDFLRFYDLVEQGAGPVKIYELLFKRLDKNGDGELNETEIIAFGDLIGSPIPLEEAQAALAMWDVDGNGSISFPEFLKALDLE
jgi:Ca2+-binding EF-hand superfamily protein